MTINLKTGGQKRFNLVILGVLAVCLTQSSVAFGQSPPYYTASGEQFSIAYELKHSVFIPGDNDVEWPDEANTYMPTNPPTTPVGDRPVSRQEARVTNNDTVNRFVSLKVIVYIRQTIYPASPLELKSTGIVTLELAPNETATLSFDHNAYNPPAMPNAPEQIIYELQLYRGASKTSSMIHERSPRKALARHH